MQYNRGRAVRVSLQVWVLGMVDISRSRCVGIMEIVDSRDAQTLLPIIQQHVRPGTTIHTDQWAAQCHSQSDGGVTASLNDSTKC